MGWAGNIVFVGDGRLKLTLNSCLNARRMLWSFVDMPDLLGVLSTLWRACGGMSWRKFNVFPASFQVQWPYASTWHLHRTEGDRRYITINTTKLPSSTEEWGQGVVHNQYAQKCVSLSYRTRDQVSSTERSALNLHNSCQRNLWTLMNKNHTVPESCSSQRLPIWYQTS